MNAPFQLRRLICLLALLAGFYQLALPAATFSVLPTTVSSGYVGSFTLQIGGLTNGEAVFLDHFVDLNTNGVVDTNDLFVGHFAITDGQQAIIGGKTNLNVPGDLTPTNAAITTLLNDFAPMPQWPVGAHMLRVSSPTGHFPSLTNNISITNRIYPEKITGNVQCNATNVPYAVIVINYGVNGGSAGFTVADSLGKYSFYALPGSYALIPVKNGYVAPSRLTVSLSTNTTVTTNLALIGANRTLAGRVVDAGKTNLGLASVFVFMQSSGGNLMATATDTNGNFSAPVTSDIWTTSIKENNGEPGLGYAFFSGNRGVTADTTTGSVSTATITLPKGTAMFYGTIRNDLGAPVPGVKFYAGSQYTNLYGSVGWSDTNGNYCAVTTTNQWDVEVSADDPIFRNYVVSRANNVTLSSNQAVRVDFTARPATGVITGNVSSVSAHVAGLLIFGNGNDGINNYQSDGITDVNGNYSFAVFNANWNVNPNCSANAPDSLDGLGYNCIAGQNVTVSSASTRVDFTVYPLGSAVLSEPGWIDVGQFGFKLTGGDGLTYYVQTSTNLANWVTITNFTLSGYSTLIEDDSATNRQRFYRTVKP